MTYDLHFEPWGHQYTVDGRFVPSVTQVLSAAGLIDLDGIPADILRRAGERGTRVHQAAALLLRGQLDWASVDPEIGGYVLALDSVIRHTGLRPEIAEVEKPIYCKEFDFCGTPDAIAWYSFPRRFGPPLEVKVVFDWKTGIMSAVRYQLAAYAHALGVRHRAAVKLNRDGTYRMEWFQPETQRHDLETFVRALKETREWVA